MPTNTTTFGVGSKVGGAIITEIHYDFPYNDVAHTEVRLHFIDRGVPRPEELQRALQSALEDGGPAIVKCAHCGQWAARRTACKHCGAPVE